MMISSEWSMPTAVRYGKNIKIKTSAHFIEICISGRASENRLIKKTSPMTRSLYVSFKEISHIAAPFLSFRTESNEAHVEYYELD